MWGCAQDEKSFSKLQSNNKGPVLLTDYDKVEVMAEQTTMKAVVFDGPRKVSVQDRPVPSCEFASLTNETKHTD